MNSRFLLSFCLLSGTIIVPGSFAAEKTEQVTLDFGKNFYPESATIHLKRRIQKIAPHLNLDRYSIDKVDVWVQSQDYMGTIHLKVGDTETAKTFFNGEVDPFTMAKLTFFRPGPASQGDWTLGMKGYYLLDHVVVTLVNQRQGLECDQGNLVARSTIINWFAMELHTILGDLLPENKGLAQLAAQVENSSATLMGLEQNSSECLKYLLGAEDVIQDYFKLQAKLLPLEKRFKYLKFQKEVLKDNEDEEMLILEGVVADFDALRQSVFRMDY